MGGGAMVQSQKRASRTKCTGGTFKGARTVLSGCLGMVQ
jgi:hypothetical protein